MHFLRHFDESTVFCLHVIMPRPTINAHFTMDTVH